MDFKGKVFIVSGGAISRELAHEDAIPVIAGRSKKEAIELSDELEKEGTVLCDYLRAFKRG